MKNTVEIYKQFFRGQNHELDCILQNSFLVSVSASCVPIFIEFEFVFSILMMVCSFLK